MDIRPIRTDRDHSAAFAEIEQLWGAPEGSDDGDQLDILVTLVEAYEDRRWPLAATDPIEAIESAMAHAKSFLQTSLEPSNLNTARQILR